jgi:hypothetical protein
LALVAELWLHAALLGSSSVFTILLLFNDAAVATPLDISSK